MPRKRMQLFCLQLEASCLQWSCFTYNSLLLTVGALLLTVLASLLIFGAFFAYSGKVRLIRALRDCKQRSLTVSKKAPTVSKKLPPRKGRSKEFQEIHPGDPKWPFWCDFPWRMRMAKVDMLGTGDGYPFLDTSCGPARQNC